MGSADEIRYRGVRLNTRKFVSKQHRRQMNTSMTHSLRELDITLLATVKHPIYWVGFSHASMDGLMVGDAYANNPKVALADIKAHLDTLLDG